MIATTGAWVSLAAYALLMVIKLLAGHYAHAQSLTADGWNNVTDVAATVAILVGLMISKKPRDQDHPYGHYRAENVSSLVISLLMAFVGIQILYSSIDSMISDVTAPVPSLWAAWVACFSAGVMLLVYSFNRRMARRTKSQALDALAKDNLSDALVSVGAILGIIGASLNWPWLDPLAALVIGCLIIKTAWGIFVGASHVLTDGFDESALDKYKTTIRQIPSVMAVTDLRARWQGNNILVDVTINVDSSLTVAESHAIADHIEETMESQHDIYKTFVHIEPAQYPRRDKSKRPTGRTKERGEASALEPS